MEPDVSGSWVGPFFFHEPFFWCELFSGLIPHSFQPSLFLNTGCFPKFPENFWKEGFLERMDMEGSTRSMWTCSFHWPLWENGAIWIARMSLTSQRTFRALHGAPDFYPHGTPGRPRWMRDCKWGNTLETLTSAKQAGCKMWLAEVG